MYKSTKIYVKRSIEKLMKQCGISIFDINIAVKEIMQEILGEK